MMKKSEVSDLIGKVCTSVTGEVGGGVITFTTECGAVYEMSHEQDCCEEVYIEDIVGDLGDLVGVPLITAREDSNTPDDPSRSEDYHFTWTFYNFATAKGYVTIRWYGRSSGYYSESVDFYRTL